MCIGVEQVLDALVSAPAHRAEPLELDERDGVEPGYELVEQADRVASLLSCLPERDRRVVELRFRYELLQREIAAIVGLSQMQVSRILSRSLARLRERHL